MRKAIEKRGHAWRREPRRSDENRRRCGGGRRGKEGGGCGLHKVRLDCFICIKISNVSIGYAAANKSEKRKNQVKIFLIISDDTNLVEFLIIFIKLPSHFLTTHP